jgi:hypothetical protein
MESWEKPYHGGGCSSRSPPGLKSIDKTAPKALTNGTARWEEEDGFIYYHGKLYVPNVKELRREVVKQCHNAITAGHPGKNGTIELVSCYYWWP